MSILTTPPALAITAQDFFASDLCTVHSKINKVCLNDWISKNGTCYEDSCCTSFETATSWYYRCAQGSHVVFSFLGLIVIMVYVLKFSSKHMLPDNVRVLVNIMLILMFAHSVDMISIHVSFGIRWIQLTKF
uniref:G_PROTEIN_RECEP_F1_2 domain-containing protein n=1 Tax=Caenorhabditis tropicalis TaxID=1561998 RepID=A0A1I7T4U8_9PELO